MSKHEPSKKPSPESLALAQQCWRDLETSDREMDIDLAKAFAKRLDAKDALLNRTRLENERLKKTAQGYAQGMFTAVEDNQTLIRERDELRSLVCKLERALKRK